MKDKKALILTGGTIDKNLVSHYLTKLKATSSLIVIAVDKGLVTADALNIPIDYLVGDFDSLTEELLQKYLDKEKQERDFEVLQFNPVKDATDTQIAIELAIKLEVDEIYVLGGTGTRLDHVIANIHLLLLPLKVNIKGYLLDNHNKIYLLNKGETLKREDLYGNYVSLLPFTDMVEGITLQGFKYPLTDKDYSLGDSLGVSNEVIMEEANILFKSGILIVIESKD